MKKALFLACLLLAALVLGAAAADGPTTTLLVYLCGSDLQEDACEDLLEMAGVEAGENITVVVLAGGSKEWDLEDLAPESRTLLVLKDGYVENSEDWGYASMGSPESLEQFLTYGLTNYPADRTVAVLWDHGCGSEGGICFDDITVDDGLTLVELDGVLSRLKESIPDFHINIWGCDACMMATYELAAMLSHYNIDYMVASEELEPGSGWYYTGWLEMLKDDPGMTDHDLCNVIIDTYMDDSLKKVPDDYLTLSAVDLSAMGELEAGMESFASVMAGELESGNLAGVRRGRSRLYTFGSFDDGSWDMVDLGAMLDIYAKFNAQQAAAAKKALSNAVIASAQTNNLDDFSGLSILLPQDQAEGYENYAAGFQLSEVIPNWLDFLNSYVSQLRSGTHHFNVFDLAQSDPGTVDWSGFIPSQDTPGGSMYWDDEEEGYQDAPSSAGQVTVTGGEQGFTASLSQEDLGYLDYVEGMLLMESSTEDMECYVDFGSLRNNLVDWNTGAVCSLFDGSWPMFGDQPVPLYDQVNNENIRRSLIPVKLNGEPTYLVVVFPGNGQEGRIIGANAGYDENGRPVRTTTPLKNGDVIIPVYTMYYEEEGKEDLQEDEFDGDPVTWQDGMTVDLVNLRESGEEDTEMFFCFVFNDIFGDSTMSDMIPFTM